MPQPKLSFDAALALALEACARQEQAALPSDAELRRLYPNLRRCDRRLRRTLAERRRKEIRPRRVWPLRRVAVVAAACALLFAGALAPQADLFGAIYTALAVRRFNKLHPETQSILEAATGLDLNGDGVVGPRASADIEATARELDTVDESAEVRQE